MQRCTILLTTVLVITGCSINLNKSNNMQPVRFNQLFVKFITKHLEVDFPIASVIRLESQHFHYSYNGSVLALQTGVRNSPDHATLNTKQLAQGDYSTVTTFNSDDIRFTFEYDNSLTCSEQDLPSEIDKQITAVFPEGLFKQFHLPYNVTIRFVAVQNFLNVQLIEPEKLKLLFYFPLNCQDVQETKKFRAFNNTISHEITHIEEWWVHSDYTKLVSFPAELGKHQLNARRMLAEYLANKVGECANVLAKDMFRYGVDFKLPEDFDEKVMQLEARVLVDWFALSPDSDILTADLSKRYSWAGKQLALTWLSKFADEEGDIRRDNRLQYQRVTEACQNVLSEQSIIDTGDFLTELLFD